MMVWFGGVAVCSSDLIGGTEINGYLPFFLCCAKILPCPISFLISHCNIFSTKDKHFIYLCWWIFLAE
jgi:hypothetical protein